LIYVNIILINLLSNSLLSHAQKFAQGAKRDYLYFVNNIKTSAMNANELKELVKRFELLNGEVFHFSNEQYQESICNDDVRNAEVFYHNSKYQLGRGYKIYFNGALIHFSKTYLPMISRLATLVNDWHLIHTEKTMQYDQQL